MRWAAELPKHLSGRHVAWVRRGKCGGNDRFYSVGAYTECMAQSRPISSWEASVRSCSWAGVGGPQKIGSDSRIAHFYRTADLGNRDYRGLSTTNDSGGRPPIPLPCDHDIEVPRGGGSLSMPEEGTTTPVEFSFGSWAKSNSKAGREDLLSSAHLPRSSGGHACKPRAAHNPLPQPRRSIAERVSLE